MLNKIIFTLSLSTLLASIGTAQYGYANNWHFGDGAALDFTSGSPVELANSSIEATEGSASYSDENGNLLFYTNGVGWTFGDGAVWNADHNVMPNGDLNIVAGEGTPTQSSLVIPVPESTTEYYLFSLDGYENVGSNYQALTYSIVDMTLDGGLGDLITKGVSVNVNNIPRLVEQFTATKHQNGTDYWLLLHESIINGSTNRFLVYQVSATGIFGPSIQDVGNTYSSAMGSMKFNPQGTRLAFGFDMFDFDNATGIISNPRDLGMYGFKSFSASGRFIYVNQPSGSISQFDTEALNLAASGVVIANNVSDFTYSQMQLGPDKKIYLAMSYEPYLSVINNPDQPGALCNFGHQQIVLQYGISSHGLPNFVESEIFDLNVDEQDFFTMSVFPNPSSDFVILNFSQTLSSEAQLSITDIHGRMVYKENLSQGLDKIKIDIRNLTTGHYHLTVQQSSRISMTKLVIE